ncbi:MAG: tRNA A37 threonylcarbamoyladenosine synthetase subunit TsaC/SUA5/YrdC [Sulfurimonas sp.]|jgi:tRNA A37 threonylcarbamoyladenosine synthetase subunit TsaC/SUA5/YrdC|uniref:hypothetical protein n=1 Tax=Sulfurimonas sp. TaxID=2022749 RepID=UPI0039E324D1
MVKSKSTSRLSTIESIILTQTDTTVGFISQNSTKLSQIKSRDASKQFIKVYPNLKMFSKSNRVPTSKKSLFRKSKKTTFIIKNKALRISPVKLQSQILRNSTWNYSTSANESGKGFVYTFCQDKADIIIQDKYGLQEMSSSTLLKISNTKIVRLR